MSDFDKNNQLKEDEEQPLITTESEPISKGFPTSVYFIIGNEFCERFSFYGMKTILFVYFTLFLKFSNPDVYFFVHLFITMAYFFPLLGGILSDSYLGKYKTILYLSLVYCLGNIVLAVTSLPGLTGYIGEGDSKRPHYWGAAVGLFLLALGTGGIKPCVSSFGGDQFDPRQTREIQMFFSMFYFAINSGSLLSTFLTPELRSIHCMGMTECFPLAFGVPALLMLVATFIFVSGHNRYKIMPISTGGNILYRILAVIYISIKQKLFPSSNNIFTGNRSWLDAAVPAYGSQFIGEVKSLLNVLWMFLPLPFFWMIYDQQSSRWVHQAQEMDPWIRIGDWKYELKPEQMQISNAFLILIMIPLFEKLIYPKNGSGYVVDLCGFLVSGRLQMEIEKGTIISVNNQPKCIENCLSILWQLPQYIILTAGEILFSVTGLEFAYSQAPASMKSVCQAAWLLTTALGNLLVAILSSSDLFGSEVEAYFGFSLALIVATFIFSLMAYYFRYSVKTESNESLLDTEDESDEQILKVE